MPYLDNEAKKANKRKWYRKNKHKWVEYREANKERIAKYQKEYRIKNREKILKQQKYYRLKNKEIRLEKQKKYYQLHKDEKKSYDKRYNKLNRVRKNKQSVEYAKKMRKNDINFRMKQNLSLRMRRALKGIGEKSAQTINLIGCSISFLKQHLEKQFTEGMTWDNYGEWEIDHIKPCVSFNLSKIEEQYQCFDYMNLQPLWKSENARKGARII